ncbi:FAD-dependent oxidoreductase [Rhodovulum sp. NI22]|nr:FAD-dependent oxidoreductase [Rhodovulum sp. NI22]
MPSAPSALQGSFDVAVIGAGVIGCAIARRFTLEGARVAVIEKAPDILDGASKGNSAILHTGFDAPPGALETACIAEGYDEYLEIHDKLGLPLIRSGALVIAWTEEEEALLPALIQQARDNGVADIAPLSAAETRALEPGLGAGVRASFRVPREYLIDPWSAPHAYLLQALANGATLLRGCEVTGGGFDGAMWRLETTRGPLSAGIVINAAGLYGDRIDARLIGHSDFTIRPRKGQFIVYDKPAAALATHILLPVPSKITKGIVVCRTAFGNLIVGPTAEDQHDRETAALVPETLAALRARGEEILPALTGQDVTAIYAGLRPASEFKDYQIRAHAGLNYVTVGAIRSTGLSSALGTARHVHRLCAEFGHRGTPLAAPVWPQVTGISEYGPRDWQCPGNGGIVCHCERVTRREIEAALSGPLAAQSLAGLKRRTRVTMGRCQGFYCSAALAALTKGRLTQPMTEAEDDR